MSETEIDIARRIASGELSSPQRFGNAWLQALRITGTGISDRPALGERVWRDPKVWLSDEMKARVAGLPVIIDHPDPPLLDDTQYSARSIGSVLHPYIADRSGIANEQGRDLWAIARLFVDDNEIEQLAGMSTSPAVAFESTDGNQMITLPDGSRCLVEGEPTHIDHCAITTDSPGVWDKGNREIGVRTDSTSEGIKMEPETKDKESEDRVERAKKDADGADPEGANSVLSAITKLAEGLDGISKRLTALEARGPAADDATKDGEDAKDPTHPNTRVHGEPFHADSLSPTHRARSAEQARADRADREARAQYQMKADHLAALFGESVQAPMNNEAPLAYRKRLLRGFQRHSPTFKDCDLHAINDEATLAGIEQVIFADATVASKTPEVPAGQLWPRTRTSESGHKITEFFGRDTIFKQLSAPTQRVLAFLTPQHMGSNRT